MSRSRLAAAVLALLACAALGCQAIQDLIPTGPSASPSPKPTVAPITIPVILPTPKPTPTPSPTPSPAPTPTPSPTIPPPELSSCGLPASNPSNPTCGVDPRQFEAQVETALTAATQAHPEYFDLNDKVCPDCYLVKNVNGYVTEVQKALVDQGICSYWDGEELAVKSTNTFSEQYDILLADNHMRRRPGAYRGDCRPALF